MAFQFTHPRDYPYELVIPTRDGGERTDVFYTKAEAIEAKKAHAAQGIRARLVVLDD